MNQALAVSVATTVLLIFTATPAVASITGPSDGKSYAASAFDPQSNQHAIGNPKPISPKLASNDHATGRQSEAGRKNVDGMQKGTLDKSPSVLLDRRM